MKKIATLPIKLLLGCLLFIFASKVDAQPEIEVSWDGSELVSGAGQFEVGDVMINVPASNWFTIKNIGSSDLTLGSINAITIGGDDPGEFLLESDPSGEVIAMNGLTGFLLTFNPTTPGSKSIIVSIESDDSDENPYTFTVTGTGIDTAPECVIPTPGFETYYTGSFSNGGLGGPIGPNGTFPFNAPSGWIPGFNSFLGALFGISPVNLDVTSDARTGDLAFELFSDPGLGGADADALTVIQCSGEPDLILSGYYKFNCAPTDQATITVFTVDNLDDSTPTNTSTLTIDTDALNYTAFELPVLYDELSDGVISILLAITGSGSSSFKLDDFQLTPPGVDEDAPVVLGSNLLVELDEEGGATITLEEFIDQLGISDNSTGDEDLTIEIGEGELELVDFPIIFDCDDLG